MIEKLKKEKQFRQQKQDWYGYLLLLPAAVLMTVLVFYPILITFSYSLQKMKLTAPDDTAFVGLENYRDVLNSADFHYALGNTLCLLILVVLLCMVCGLGLSSILNVRTRLQGFLTAIAILPWALPPVVNGILWKWIFYPGYGFLNKILIRLHFIDIPVQWLSQRWTLLAVVALVASWRNIPFCTVVYISAMQAIPDSVIEAAAIDGAGPWQRFQRITFPLLLPASGVVLTSTSISAVNVFDEIVSLAGYGDLGKTLLIQDYLTTFSFLDFGTGSALSYLIMILAGLLGLLYLKSIAREGEEV